MFRTRSWVKLGPIKVLGALAKRSRGERYERVCFDVVGEQQEKKGSGMHSQILGKWAPDPPTPKSRNLVPNRPGTPFFKVLVSVS